MIQGLLNYIGRLCNKSELFSEEYVCNVLERMDKSDPAKRCPNAWDERFRQMVPVLHKYDAALAYLQKYGYLCDTYFSCLQNPQDQPELQRCFCRVEKYANTNDYALEYPNLVCAYLRRWDFCEEVYNEVFGEEKYSSVRRLYALIRKI